MKNRMILIVFCALLMLMVSFSGCSDDSDGSDDDIGDDDIIIDDDIFDDDIDDDVGDDDIVTDDDDAEPEIKNIVIVSYMLYHQDGGENTYVYGEIINKESFPLEDIELEITLYDSTHKKVRTETVYGNGVGLIGGGAITISNQKVPFLLETGDKDGTITSADVEFVSAYKAEESPYRYIKILSQDDSYDILFGEYSIDGEVENTGTEAMDWVNVIATYYDSNGEVIGASYCNTDPLDIGAGQKADYNIIAYDSEMDTSAIEKYVLSTYTDTW